MLFTEAVLEAVHAVAGLAVDARVLQRVDEGLAFRVGALLRGEDGGFLGWAAGDGRLADAVFSSVLGPFAGVAAFVRRLGAVVEAVGVVAGVAAEGEEVELVAVGELAVRADGFEVGGVHLCE